MSSESRVAVFPIAVSPSNQAWIYMKTQSEKNGAMNLASFGGSVTLGKRVSEAANRFLESQSRGVFSQYNPTTVSSMSYPISSDTLKNDYLTKITSCKDSDVNYTVYAAKLYSGSLLGQDKNDIFIKQFRENYSGSGSGSARTLSDHEMARIDLSDITSQYLNCNTESCNYSLDAYGEDLSDMKKGNKISISPNDHSIFSNRNVLLKLSQTADELKEMNIMAPRHENHDMRQRQYDIDF